MGARCAIPALPSRQTNAARGMPRRKPPRRAERAQSKRQAVERDIVRTALPSPWPCARCGLRGTCHNAARELWTAPAEPFRVGSQNIRSRSASRLFPGGSRRTTREFRRARRFDPAPRAPPKSGAGRSLHGTRCTPFRRAHADEPGNPSRCRYGRPRTIHAASAPPWQKREAAGRSTPPASNP